MNTRTKGVLPPKPKCKAHKTNGDPCGRWPVKGATVCPKHGGSAPQVRRKAQERLAEAADSLMAALLKIASSAESEAVRLAAIKDALDRAGFAPAQLVKIGFGQEDKWGDLLEEIMTDDEVLVPVDNRAISSKPHSRTLARDRVGVSDDDDGPDVQIIGPADDDEDDDTLSWNTPGTIRGEVVPERRDYPTPTPQQAARAARSVARATSAGLDDAALERTLSRQPSEFDPRRSPSPASDDPNEPPAYVQEAMRSEGQDWREPGRTRGNTTWTR